MVFIVDHKPVYFNVEITHSPKNDLGYILDNLCKISPISARCRQFWRDLCEFLSNLGKMFVSFQYHSEISAVLARFLPIDLVRCRQSWQDVWVFPDHGEISPSFRKHKHHSEISTKSWQSRRDLIILGEM